MDVKKNIEKLCLANGISYNNDVYKLWEELITEDIEANKFEPVDVTNTLKKELRMRARIKTYGELFFVIKGNARERIYKEKIKCPQCLKIMDIPAENAIRGSLQTNCSCGTTRKDIINYYQSKPIVQNLWSSLRKTESISPQDKTTDEGRSTTMPNVQYYD
jgi:hypothetical protein